MGVIPDRIVVLSATAAFAVCAVDQPSHKTEAQGRIGVFPGQGKSLSHRPDHNTLGIDGVCKCWKRIHLGNPDQFVSPME